MVPASLTDSERFRTFLKYLNPNFEVPSRKKLTSDVKNMGSKVKSELTHLLSQQRYLATTGKILRTGCRALRISFLNIFYHSCPITNNNYLAKY